MFVLCVVWKTSIVYGASLPYVRFNVTGQADERTSFSLSCSSGATIAIAHSVTSVRYGSPSSSCTVTQLASAFSFLRSQCLNKISCDPFIVGYRTLGLLADPCLGAKRLVVTLTCLLISASPTPTRTFSPTRRPITPSPILNFPPGYKLFSGPFSGSESSSIFFTCSESAPDSIIIGVRDVNYASVPQGTCMMDQSTARAALYSALVGRHSFQLTVSYQSLGYVEDPCLYYSKTLSASLICYTLKGPTVSLPTPRPCVGVPPAALLSASSSLVANQYVCASQDTPASASFLLSATALFTYSVRIVAFGQNIVADVRSDDCNVLQTVNGLSSVQISLRLAAGDSVRIHAKLNPSFCGPVYATVFGPSRTPVPTRMRSPTRLGTSTRRFVPSQRPSSSRSPSPGPTKTPMPGTAGLTRYSFNLGDFFISQAQTVQYRVTIPRTLSIPITYVQYLATLSDLSTNPAPELRYNVNNFFGPPSFTRFFYRGGESYALTVNPLVVTPVIAAAGTTWTVTFSLSNQRGSGRYRNMTLELYSTPSLETPIGTPTPLPGTAGLSMLSLAVGTLRMNGSYVASRQFRIPRSARISITYIQYIAFLPELSSRPRVRFQYAVENFWGPPATQRFISRGNDQYALSAGLISGVTSPIQVNAGNVWDVTFSLAANEGYGIFRDVRVELYYQPTVSLQNENQNDKQSLSTTTPASINLLIGVSASAVGVGLFVFVSMFVIHRIRARSQIASVHTVNVMPHQSPNSR